MQWNLDVIYGLKCTFAGIFVKPNMGNKLSYTKHDMKKIDEYTVHKVIKINNNIFIATF